MYGKVMSIPDALMPNYYTLLTDTSTEEVAAIEVGLADRRLNPMDTKKRLARSIVALLYGDADADAAQGEFERVFQRREDPSESATEVSIGQLPHAAVAKTGSITGDLPFDLVQVVSQFGAVSMSEARRLIDQGAVSKNGEVVRDRVVEIGVDDMIRIGRHKFLKVTNG